MPSDLGITTSHNGGREGFGFWSRQLSECVFGMLGSVSCFYWRCGSALSVSSYSSMWLFAGTAVKTRRHRGAWVQDQPRLHNTTTPPKKNQQQKEGEINRKCVPWFHWPYFKRPEATGTSWTVQSHSTVPLESGTLGLLLSFGIFRPYSNAIKKNGVP